MIEVTLEDLTALCNRFRVNFSMEIENAVMGRIIYVFGPVRWTARAGEKLLWEEYFEIGLRLASFFPERVEYHG